MLKNYMLYETLRPLETFKDSQKRFDLIRDNLISKYSAYQNREKIVTLLEFWLFNIRSLYFVYGKSGLKKFCEGKINNPSRFAMRHHGIVRKEQLKFKLKGNKTLFSILNYFFKKYYLVGADLNTITKKVLWRISRYLVFSSPLNCNLDLKQEIMEDLKIYFSDLSLGKLEELVEKKLPEIFYADPINLKGLSKNGEVECAAACFLEFDGFENIFLFNKPLFIRGLQHGGGYGTFKIDYFAYYEEALCDVFVGWGLLGQNSKQKRFKKIPKNNKPNTSKSKKRIIWVEDCFLPKFYYMLMPFHHYQFKDTESTKYIYQELTQSKLEYLNLPHPVPSDKYEPYQKKIINRENLLKGETLFLPGDVGIFDNSGATLMHFFVENDMPFLHIIDSEDKERFSSKQLEWFNILYKSNLAFYNHEDGKLAAKLIEIMNEGYSLPEEVVNYHRKYFFTN